MQTKLELETEIGKGSIFHFTLPTEIEILKTKDWKNLKEIEKVLVVDDNKTNRTILKEMLSIRGISTEEATSGFEAVQKLQENKSYDLVIMDYHMPYMDGLETVRVIRNKMNFSPNDLPIILLHSSSDEANIQEICKELKIQRNIIKPIKIQKLFDSISKLKFETEFFNTIELHGNTTISPEKTEYGILKILMVDDNPVNVFLLKTILTQIVPNAILTEANSGKKAIDIAKAEKLDLIFLDVQMPEMNGYETAIQIRKFDNSTPIIALTAGTVKGERDRCIEAGMNDYITKPIVKNTIEKIITKWILQNPDSFTKPIQDNLTQEKSLSHFNRELLLERIDYDEEFLIDLTRRVAENIHSDLLNLKQSCETKDIRKISDAAHKIKGTALTLCFEQLAYLTENLELTEQYNETYIQNMLQQIEMEINLIITLI